MQYYKHVSAKEFVHPNTCHDMIEGKCYYGLSRKECLNKCNSNNCTYGFFINKNQLNSSSSEAASITNPSQTICMISGNKNIHPLEMVKRTNKDIDFFLRKNMFEAKYEGTVNYMDKIYLARADDFPLFGGQPLQIWKSYLKYSEHVHYGDSVNLRKFMTNWFLYADICESAADFVHNSSIYFTEELNFYIMSPAHRAGDQVKYGDEFYITTKNHLILTTCMNLVYGDPEILQNKGIDIMFKFKPEIDLYYCAGKNKCAQISAGDLDKNNKYKGKNVYRSNNCYLNC